MTRYIRKEPCSSCGQPHWFRYWVGRNCLAAKNGLSVCDGDLIFHRFKRIGDPLGERDIEHMMMVEVKTGTEELFFAQHDTLSTFSQRLLAMAPPNGRPIGVQSRAGTRFKEGTRKVKLLWHGVHLIRVPFTPNDAGPFAWNNKVLDRQTLIDVLNMDRDPRRTDRRLDVDRRHKRPRDADLFTQEANP